MDKLLDEEGIKKLFEDQSRNTLECIKEDWTLGISLGNKYIIEMSDGEYITFKNDNDDQMSMKIKNAIKHFVTITNSRKRKFNKLFK